MKKILTLPYKGFSTTFYITPKVEKYLQHNGYDLQPLLRGPHNFYEVELFEFLDDNNDGEVEEKYGKQFKIIYCGIITRWINKDTEGFQERFNHQEEEIIKGPYHFMLRKNEGKEQIGVTYLILKDNGE